MNATEQRTHRTVTQSLDERLAVVESLTEQLLRNDVALANAIESLRKHLDLVLSSYRDEHHARLDKQDQILDVQISYIQKEWTNFLDCHQHTFWQRLRWLLVGR